jgi:hypothetical protein
MRSSRVTPNTVATVNEWNALHEDARGASRLLAHQMYGTIALPTNPTNGQTLTLDINGTNVVITFVSSIGSTPGNVLIGASAAATVANLLQLLQNPTFTTATQIAIGANTDANVTLVNYIAWSLSGTSIIASSNAFSLYTPDTSFSASTTATGGSYTANKMALYVEPGVVFVNGTEVYFAGGVSPTVTAPTSHPRIDVLSINSSGVLSWTTGTEASSPSTPAYPANQIPICELYNVVGETALYDQSNQQSGQGYIYNDVRPFLTTGLNTGEIPDSLVPSAASTYDLGSTSFPWRFIYGNGAFITGLNTSRAVQAFTAGATINASTTPQAVYVKASDGKVYPADVGADESTYKFIGFVGDGQNVSANASVNVTISGYLAGFSSLTQNASYYLNSSGAVSTTPDTTRPLRVAFAVSTTAIILISGQRIRYITDTYSGTAGATHTITCGFRPRLVVGVAKDGSGTHAGYGQFQTNELAQMSIVAENGIPTLYTDRIGEMWDASASSYKTITTGSFTDTGFSATYPASTSSVSATVSFIIYGE